MRRLALLLALMTLMLAAVAGHPAMATGEEGTKPPILGLAYGNGRFVATAEGNTVFVSSDGQTWEQHTVPAESNSVAYTIGEVAFGAGQFVAVAENVRYPGIYTSPDGTTWTLHGAVLPDPSAGFRYLTYGDGRFVMAVASSVSFETTRLYWSEDGVSWHPADAAGGRWHRVSYGGGRFVALSDMDTVLTSPDGAHWTAATLPFAIGAPVYGPAKFYAVADGGTALAESKDGVTWEKKGLPPLPPGVPAVVTAVGYVPGHLQMVLQDGTLLDARDGRRWGADPSGVPWAAAAHGITRLYAYGAGRLVTAQGSALQTVTLCGARFPDVPGDRAGCEAVEVMAARHVINGYPDGTFGPDQAVTRAEFAAMLAVTLEPHPAPSLVLPFSDTSSHWVAERGYLQAIVNIGAINGYPDGTFRPDTPVTRAELIKIVLAAAGFKPGGTPAYTDVAAGDWFAGWTAAALEARVIGSRAPFPVWTGSAFGSEEPATRVEAAIVLANLVSVVR